ncbi:MAG: molybdopterin-binding protein [Nitrososphaerota archaeon]
MASRRKVRPSTAEIIVVGNEVLNGEVLDTNSNWLAKQLYFLGLELRRVTVVRDDLREIAGAVRDAIRRRAEWIITSGGLGPTHDDMTLEAVALATNRKTVLNPEALEMLKERYARLYEMGVVKEAELTPSRLPRGAKALRNRAGSAPGSLLRYKGSRIVSLPGVPRELKDIFLNEVVPLIKAEARRVFRYAAGLLVRGVPESSMAPVLRELASERPELYVKSHPKGLEEGVSVVEVVVHGEGQDPEKVKDAVESLIGSLEERLRAFQPVELRRMSMEEVLGDERRP